MKINSNLNFDNSSRIVNHPAAVASGDLIIKSDLDSAIASINQQLAIATYGEEAILDSQLNMILARQLRFEGLGVNQNEATGYLRRFHGGHIVNTAGLIFNLGILITSVELTCSYNRAGRSIDFRHYALDGTDEKIAGSFVIDKEDNQFGFLTNARIFIPGRRRFAPIMLGPNFGYPQMRLSYRKVLQIL